jgi:tetratricopeptide (TPR) repeat protein
MPLPDWYISDIQQLQAIGFFKEESTKAVADYIIKSSEDSYFGNILDLSEDPLYQLILSSYDQTKVWFVEDFLSFGNSYESYDFYEQVLKNLEKISNVKFEPKQISKQYCGYCSGRDRRLQINFELDGKAQNINFCIDGSVLELDFLTGINEMLAPQNCSFEYILDSYGPCFVFFLENDQKDHLEKVFNWEFYEPSGYWRDRAIYANEQGLSKDTIKYFEKALAQEKDYHSFSEFANFWRSAHKPEKAKEIYLQAIDYLEELDYRDQIQDWWLKQFQTELQLLH